MKEKSLTKEEKRKRKNEKEETYIGKRYSVFQRERASE
jgi:hypothetical protein